LDQVCAIVRPPRLRNAHRQAAPALPLGGGGICRAGSSLITLHDAASARKGGLYECDLNYCFLGSENLAGPIAADQIRPRIVRDRAVRAWLGEDGGRATLAARLNSCSQPSAELFVLLLETSQSLHTAFFNDKISL